MRTTPTFDQLMVEVDARNVARSDHPDGLSVFNYTVNCTFGRRWNSVNREARGLVFETASKLLVARPWGKFFNLHEPEAGPIPESPPDAITVKYDGSLGIGFMWQNHLWWSTRGTLSSPQAHVARRLCPTVNDPLREGAAWITLLVEIISPATKVVVDYGDKEELRLLGATACWADGKWVDMNMPYVHELGRRLGLPVADSVNADLVSIQKMAQELDHNNEGFVLRWGDQRIKVKTKAYVDIARVLTGLSDRTVGDMWYCQANLPENLPEEVDAAVRATWAKYDREVDDLRARVQDLILHIDPVMSRKDLAFAFKAHPMFDLIMRATQGSVPDYKRFVYRQHFAGCNPRD